MCAAGPCEYARRDVRPAAHSPEFHAGRPAHGKRMDNRAAHGRSTVSASTCPSQQYFVAGRNFVGNIIEPGMYHRDWSSRLAVESGGVAGHPRHRDLGGLPRCGPAVASRRARRDRRSTRARELVRCLVPQNVGPLRDGAQHPDLVPPWQLGVPGIPRQRVALHRRLRPRPPVRRRAARPGGPSALARTTWRQPSARFAVSRSRQGRSVW